VIAGGIVGFGAWLAYVPHLQAATGHVIDPLGLPWWVIITGMALAVITAMLAARHPARMVARVPVVAALSGRPPRLAAAHRSAGAGLTTLAAGLVLLLFSGGGPTGGSLLVGLVVTSVGMFLLASGRSLSSCSTRADLPTPASPATKTSRPSPCRASSAYPASDARHASRSSNCTITLSPAPAHMATARPAPPCLTRGPGGRPDSAPLRAG
jgi:hypothetical protein